MLVLTRKVDESVNIGDDIVIKVVEVNGLNIKLGIEAPRHVKVYRGEIYEKIREENLKSALGRSSDLSNAAALWKRAGSKE
ncbi:MAG: carbon storage regulator CsrA [Deltaproteobacteria bacterium]